MSEEKETCQNCGSEYEDDGDVFDCRACRTEICVGCESEHRRRCPPKPKGYYEARAERTMNELLSEVTEEKSK